MISTKDLEYEIVSAIRLYVSLTGAQLYDRVKHQMTGNGIDRAERMVLTLDRLVREKAITWSPITLRYYSGNR